MFCLHGLWKANSLWKVNLNELSLFSSFLHHGIVDYWASSFIWGLSSCWFFLSVSSVASFSQYEILSQKKIPSWNRYVRFSSWLLWSKRVFPFACTGCSSVFPEVSGWPCTFTPFQVPVPNLFSTSVVRVFFSYFCSVLHTINYSVIF